MNLTGQTYPDQSLYPANSVPAVVRRLISALQRADQIDLSEGATSATARADRSRCRGRLERSVDDHDVREVVERISAPSERPRA